MLLETRDLHAGYGRREVLHGIDLAVAKGGVAVILGTNGAGKSTTLRALIGTVRVSSGSLVYDGQELRNPAVASNVSRGMALVPEAGGVFREFTVSENLMLGAYTVTDQDLVQERLSMVLEVFPKLADRLKQKASTLSGGERQMLAIGRALMSGPQLLMLDEPFLGLAPAVNDVVVDALRRLNQDNGLTLLVSEQNVRILDIATHAYVLRLGQIVIDESDPKALVSDASRLEASFIG